MPAIEPARPAMFARIQYRIDPTLPPGQRSVPGDPDPRTATCEQHRVAAPYSDTAKGDDTAIYPPEGAEYTWPCVVCPLPDADLIGTEVVLAGYSGSFIYAGIGSHGPEMLSIGLMVGSGGKSTVECDPELVAPVDTPINDKDPRFTVEKLPKKRYAWDAGPWLTHVEGIDGAKAHKTRRDAVEYATTRLAIRDYHAQRDTVAGAA